MRYGYDAASDDRRRWATWLGVSSLNVTTSASYWASVAGTSGTRRLMYSRLLWMTVSGRAAGSAVGWGRRRTSGAAIAAPVAATAPDAAASRHRRVARAPSATGPADSADHGISDRAAVAQRHRRRLTHGLIALVAMPATTSHARA